MTPGLRNERRNVPGSDRRVWTVPPAVDSERTSASESSTSPGSPRRSECHVQVHPSRTEVVQKPQGASISARRCGTRARPADKEVRRSHAKRPKGSSLPVFQRPLSAVAGARRLHPSTTMTHRCRASVSLVPLILTSLAAPAVAFAMGLPCSASQPPVVSVQVAGAATPGAVVTVTASADSTGANVRALLASVDQGTLDSGTNQYSVPFTAGAIVSGTRAGRCPSPRAVTRFRSRRATAGEPAPRPRRRCPWPRCRSCRRSWTS